MPVFDKFASNYKNVLDGSVGSAGYFADGKAQWIARQLGQEFKGSILDFGCGVGLLAEAMASHLPTAQLTGYDVSTDSLATVAPVLRERTKFTSDPAEMGQNHDIVVVSNVLHHIPVKDRDQILADLARRLAPGGKLMIFEHNPSNLLTQLIVARCPFDDDAVLLWPGEALTRLRRAGLTPTAPTYVAFFPKPLARLRALEAHLGWCPLGAQYVAVGERP